MPATVKAAIRAAHVRFPKGTRVRHCRTGGVYTIVYTPAEVIIEKDAVPSYAYRRADADGQGGVPGPIWIRPAAEMEDGRFELVTP